FGFSVQKQIWIDCGGTPGRRNDDVACKFGDQVGWLKNGIWIDYNSINWNMDNPRGHLPTPPPVVVLGILWNWLDGFYFLSSRI
ncbi:MAG TPA: GUN4 domain-containing protein, partial [Allocoleopsis sp.]